MRVGYLGPEGTFTQEALLAAAPAGGLDLVPLATIHETVMAVAGGEVQRALVPIENSIEGAVGATLDALTFETQAVEIVGEVVHPIRQCLIARGPLDLGEVEAVVSHPQASAQCGRFLRKRLPAARVLPAASTAEAVRTVVAERRPWAAIGPELAARRHGGHLLERGVEDVAGNETRFVWLGPAGAPAGLPGEEPGASWKTAVVFWGVGAERPGWLLSCLSEFADREVNLTRIESRPLKQGLGRYMFFIDLEGRADDPRIADSLSGLGGHVDVLRVLGSFPAAA